MESYGPRTTSLTLERSSMVQALLLRQRGLVLRRPFLPPDSIPPSMASAFVLAAASMTAVSLRSLSFNPNLTTPRPNPLQPGNFGHVPSVRRANKRRSHWNISRARLRILRKPSDDFVSSVFSSNRLDKATYQRASSIQHWNVHSGSAGLRPFSFGYVACPAASAVSFSRSEATRPSNSIGQLNPSRSSIARLCSSGIFDFDSTKSKVNNGSFRLT